MAASSINTSIETSEELSKTTKIPSGVQTRNLMPDILGMTNQIPVSTNQQELQRIGRYQIKRKLGAGGMGAVYLGIDDRDQSEVAIKVLHQDGETDLGAIRRFQKEAKLLSEVQHPHVSNLKDAGEQGGICYLVMEFVDGIDLKGLLAAEKRLSETLALGIIRDLSDALAAAHARGIIHRDIKPANILVNTEPMGGESALDSLLALIRGGHHPIVKLTDFGLARHVDQSESMALTRTGAMLGTPYYLSPEQCSDQGKISPATDIYALGVTLFELLAGRPPFHASDPVKLITLHCFEAPPDIRKLNPDVSDGVAALIDKCLEKAPARRFADGAHLRDEIDQLLRGETNNVAVHPLVPEAEASITENIWEWELKSSPDKLWPYVSNTERINQAVGLPGVTYETERDENGRLRKYGSFKLGWSKLTWEEHPFEWIEGQRLGVLREFEKGPFYWFASIVEISPRPEGGTRLKHHVRIATRGMMGRFIAHVEVNVKGKKNLDKVYQRIDEVVSRQNGRITNEDPFAAPPKPAKTMRQRIAARQAALEEAGLDTRCVQVLANHLMQAPSQDLARIKPFEVAASWNLPRDTFAEVCLQACSVGLLELHWDILCPTCRVSSSVKDTISDIEQHSYCEACDLEFETDFQNAIELIFRVHPEIRQADLKTYCIGGPEHAPHVVAQAILAPGEKLEFNLELDAGSYTLRGPQLPYSAGLIAESNQGAGRTTLKLSQDFNPRCKTRLQAGRQVLTLENGYEIPMLVRLERAVANDKVLTAAGASRIPMFQELFPGEVLSREQLTDYTTCTLLGVRITDIEELFSRSSESGAFRLMSEAFEKVEQAVNAYRGEVIKKQDDRLLIAFRETLDAIEFSQTVLQEHAQQEHPIPLGLTLHRGTTMTTTMNGKMDYFGRAVTTANSLLEKAIASRLLLSSDLALDGEVKVALEKMSFIKDPDQQTKAAAFRLSTSSGN